MGAAIGIILYFAIIIAIFVGVWKAFVKAGQPGWALLIPIYPLYCMTQMANKPGWWVLLFFVPIANIVVMFILMMEIAKNFGKSSGFGVGMVLMGGIFWPILGYGDAQFNGAEKVDDTEVLDA